MSRLIQPCPDCPGVRYQGEPCRCCEAIAQARREGASEALERVAALEAALREAVGYLTAEADIHAGAEEGYHDFLGRARALVERALEVTP